MSAENELSLCGLITGKKHERVPFTPGEQCTSLAKYLHELKTTINSLNLKSNKRLKLLEIVSNIEVSGRIPYSLHYPIEWL
jgi:hypothetical protein